jgi:hypothetical protein
MSAAHGYERGIRIVLVLVGVITATPVFALVAPGILTGYGIDRPEGMMLALLQHRGVLQAALGAALVWAAFRPELRIPAALTAIATKSTFMALTLPIRVTGGALFDAVAIALLAGVVAMQLLRVRRSLD